MQKLRLVLALALFISVCLAYPKVIVHFIPHSHVDPGWYRTMEAIYKQPGKQILDTVTDALYENEEYRFSWADTIFIDRWWGEATEEQKERMRTIVKRKQLQFVHPGWIMNDEAVVPFADMMEQFEVGLHFLRDTFGEVPHIAWQIDTFGNSAYTPAVLNKYGVDTIYLSRIGQRNKMQMKYQGKLNFVWQGHPVDGDVPEVFVCLSQAFTYSPMGFDYDPKQQAKHCKMEQLEKYQPSYCLDMFVKDSLGYILHSDFYSKDQTVKEVHLPVLFGDDQAYSDAHFSFKFIDKLKENLNQHSLNIYKEQYEARYSTMDEFLQALQDNELQYDIYRGDFLPLIDDMAYQKEDEDHSLNFWTGYYSNKPTFKTAIREFLDRIHSTNKLMGYIALQKYLYLSEGLSSLPYQRLLDSQTAGLLLLHHDAITGTHTDGAWLDYVDKLKIAEGYLGQAEEALHAELGEMENFKNIDLSFFDQHLQSVISSVQVVRVFSADLKDHNSRRFELLLPKGQAYVALDEEMRTMQGQSFPITYFSSQHQDIRVNQTAVRVEFEFPQFLHYSLQFMFLVPFKNDEVCQEFIKSVPAVKLICINGEPVYNKKTESNKFQIFGNQGSALFSELTGLLTKLRIKGTDLEVRQKLKYYQSPYSSSGFYLFDPMEQAVPFEDLKLYQVWEYEGALYRKCLHFFLHQTYLLQVHENAFFENIVCMDMGQEDFLHWELKAKGVKAHEIVLETEIVRADQKSVGDNWEYFTDDSMLALNRKVFTKTQARERNIYYGLQANPPTHHFTLQKPSSLDPGARLNSYPCNQGLILQERDEIITGKVEKQIALGLAFSHPLMCILKDNSTFQLMLTRDTQNFRNQQGLVEGIDDFQYSHLKILLNLGDVLGYEKKNNFIATYENMKEKLFQKPLVYKTPKGTFQKMFMQKNEKWSLESSQILDSNPQLTLLRSKYDPHSNKIYFQFRNKFRTMAESNVGVLIPEDWTAGRCKDHLFCDDFEKQQEAGFKMKYKTSDTQLKMIEYQEYRAFQFEDYDLDQTGDGVKPFGMESLWIQLPLPVEALGNHFESTERKFYSSEKKMKYFIDKKSTCLKLRNYGIILLGSAGCFLFMVYAFLRKSCARKQSKVNKKPLKNESVLPNLFNRDPPKGD